MILVDARRKHDISRREKEEDCLLALREHEYIFHEKEFQLKLHK